MADAGYPIIGDKQYGVEGGLFRGKGLFLAAVELSLTHPVTGVPVNVKIDEPEKFRTFMEREERRWRNGDGGDFLSDVILSRYCSGDYIQFPRDFQKYTVSE